MEAKRLGERGEMAFDECKRRTKTVSVRDAGEEG